MSTKLYPLYSTFDKAFDAESLQGHWDESESKIVLSEPIQDYLLNMRVETLTPFLREGESAACFWVRDLNQTETADLNDLCHVEKKTSRAFLKAFELGVQKVTDLTITSPETGHPVVIPEWSPNSMAGRDALGQQYKKMSVKEREEHFGFQTTQEIGALIFKRCFR